MKYWRAALARACLAVAATLAGCGGGGGSGEAAEANASLQGTWYFKDPTAPNAYARQHVIRQNGDEVFITSCDKTTDALRLVDGKLVDSEGAPYHLQPDGPGRLVGPPLPGALPGTSTEVRRFSNRTQFDGGQLQITVTGEDNVSANQDVCAESGPAHFILIDGTEIRPTTLSIAGPHKGTHARLELAFHALHVGTYEVRHLMSFAHTPGDTAYVWLDSPEYGKGETPHFHQIVAGELRVIRLTATHADVSALMETDDGQWISFSANVKINQKPF